MVVAVKQVYEEIRDQIHADLGTTEGEGGGPCSVALAPAAAQVPPNEAPAPTSPVQKPRGARKLGVGASGPAPPPSKKKTR